MKLSLSREWRQTLARYNTVADLEVARIGKLMVGDARTQWDVLKVPKALAQAKGHPKPELEKQKKQTLKAKPATAKVKAQATKQAVKAKPATAAKAKAKSKATSHKV